MHSNFIVPRVVAGLFGIVAITACAGSSSSESSAPRSPDERVRTQTFAALTDLTLAMVEPEMMPSTTPLAVGVRRFGPHTVWDVAPARISPDRVVSTGLLPGFTLAYLYKGPEAGWVEVRRGARQYAVDVDDVYKALESVEGVPGAVALWQPPRVGGGDIFAGESSLSKFTAAQADLLEGDWSRGIAIPLLGAHQVVSSTLAKISAASAAGDAGAYDRLIATDLASIEHFFGTFSTEWGDRNAMRNYFAGAQSMAGKRIEPTGTTRGWRTVARDADANLSIVTETLTPARVVVTQSGETVHTVVRVRWVGGVPVAFHSDRTAPAQALHEALPEGYLIPLEAEPKLNVVTVPDKSGMTSPAPERIRVILQNVGHALK